MSIEMHVFFRGKLPDKKDLSRAMVELGFPLTIKAGSLERQRGFMPMRLRREEAGVEFDVFDRAHIEDLAGDDFDPRFERSASFRWGGDEDQMLCGVCAAAALAKLVDGVVLDEQEDKLLSPDEAIALARETLQAMLKRGLKRAETRPADIKRYLKPLLKQRSDLVVIGRMLLIRPVRHVLRGAFLDKTSDKYQFRIWPYLQPLWSPNWGFNFRYLHDDLWSVWYPDFESLLIDALQQDVFTPLGKIASHEDLADALPDDLPYFTPRMSALLLAGERERAEECVRAVETSEYAGRYRDEIKSARNLLARDIKEVCAEFHAREAKAVKREKLEAIWEPSPFPVEEPGAERKTRTDEPLFVPEPWLPRPAGLLLEVPQAPGEVRFAEKWLFREGLKSDLANKSFLNPILVAALTRDEAEERHRNGEHYVLAAGLPGGRLLLLKHYGRDRHDPEYPRPIFAGGFYLALHGVHFVATASSTDRPDADGLLVVGASVSNRETGWSIWASRLDREDARIWIWDRRNTDPLESGCRIKKATDAEMNQFRCPMPGFGEFDAAVRVVLDLLRSEGYGEVE